MKLQINAVHFTADQGLLDFIQQKADKLETFYDQIISGDVYLRLEKDKGDRHEKIVEIKLFVPGPSLFAKESAPTFEAATDAVMDAMKVQLKKLKQKVHHE